MMSNVLKTRFSRELVRNLHTSRFAGQESKSIISKLDILGDSKPPLNNITKTTKKGIVFDSGVIVPSDKVCLLLSNQVLEFQPDYKIKNGFIVEFDLKSLQFLKLINPLPELMIIGLGSKSRLLSDLNLNLFRDLGTKVEVSDTLNACKNFDLLATERPNQIGAILLPVIV